MDILGIAARFLPPQPPFSITLSSANEEGRNNLLQADFSRISRADLQSALKEKEAFYEMYVTMTNRAIELYVAAGRRKFALRMHGSLAALDV